MALSADGTPAPASPATVKVFSSAASVRAFTA
jgi:hypothetical protein